MEEPTKEVVEETVTPEVVVEPTDPSQEEVDYKALAEAEKARADAAEALIVKNKALAKRNETKPEGEPQALTEEKVVELIKKVVTTSKEDSDDSPEAKAYADAQAKVRELQAKNAELGRAQKAKDGVSKDSATTHRDGEAGTEPKLPDNSPLKAYKYEGNGIYSIKLASGKTMFKNTKVKPGQPSSWVQ